MTHVMTKAREIYADRLTCLSVILVENKQKKCVLSAVILFSGSI